jgi:predicted lipoprotein with Yx(FWY)xxD motif
MAGDGDGGAIIAWTDGRAGDDDIFAQRLDAKGRELWSANGIPVCTARKDQTAPSIVADGSGGAVIVWIDDRNGDYDIYAQRVGGEGRMLWQPGGVPVCTAPNDQVASTLVSDGSGGAIVAWRDLRTGISYDIYAQRLSPAGATRWSPGGVAVCSAPGRQADPAIAGDASGGAVIAWLDNRGGSEEIYAQRLTAAGTPAWNLNGALVSGPAIDCRSPGIIADGAGGGIVVWRDARSGSSYDIYAQRINGSGQVQWAGSGIPLCAAPGDQESPRIVTDGQRGGIVVWTDKRSGSTDIYAQHLDISGAVGWAVDGIPVCRAPGNQMYPAAAGDGLGGAIVTWLDERRGEGDIYAQRISGLGSAVWTADGIAVCTSPGEQFNPAVISGAARGAIIAWYDYRSGANSDIVAQKVDRVGYLGDAAPRIAGTRSSAGESERKTTLLWSRSYADTWPSQTVTGYALWRGVRAETTGGTASFGTGGAASYPKTNADWLAWASSPSGGGGDTIYWQYVTTVKPHWLAGYAYTLTIPPDFPESEEEYYMVTALTSDPLVYWDSEITPGTPPGSLPSQPPPLSGLRRGLAPLAARFVFPAISGGRIAPKNNFR